MKEKKRWENSNLYIKEYNEKKENLFEVLNSLKSSFLTTLLTTVLTSIIFISLSSGCGKIQQSIQPNSKTNQNSPQPLHSTSVLTDQNTTYTSSYSQKFKKNNTSTIKWSHTNQGSLEESATDSFNRVILSEPGKYKITYKISLNFNLNHDNVNIQCNHYNEENTLIEVFSKKNAYSENSLEKTITTLSENTTLEIQINNGYAYLIPGKENSFLTIKKL